MSALIAPARGMRLPRDQRRAQLLQAAQEVFVDQGYHSAGMDVIAERAQVSKPVLYQHFPSKFDLYLAVLDQHVDALVDLLQQALESTTDNLERVRGSIGAYFSFVDREGSGFRLIFESDLISDGGVQERLARVNNSFSDAIAAIIDKETELPLAQAQLLGHALAGATQRACLTWVESGTGVNIDEAVDVMVRLVWGGLSGFPSTSGEDVDASSGA